MADITPEDAELLGLSDEDLDVLADVYVPETPDVILDDREREWLETAEEVRAADLERVSTLSEDAVRYLSEPGSDPVTDGLSHDYVDESDLRRLSDIAEQPEDLLEIATASDVLLLEEIAVLPEHQLRGAAGGVRIPGAVWRPFTQRTVSTTPLIGPRAIIEHTMGVGTMNGSWNYHNQVGRPYSHTYYDGIGNRIQVQGADRRSAATLEGNPYVIAKETEDYGKYFSGGGTTCGTIPAWRQEQLRVIALDDAWCCKRFGIPAVLMPDSCSGTRGIGYHRLGIDPWRKAGCLEYSTARGKCCPDVARISQMPGLVRSIKTLVDGPTPPPPDATQERAMLLLL